MAEEDVNESDTERGKAAVMNIQSIKGFSIAF
jgi:hypothetical protein